MVETGVRERLSLLLVSTNYAPESAGTSRYATQIAEHWAAGGAAVDVVTGMPHYPAWRLDPAYAGVRQVREERGGVRVHRRAHTVPARQTALRRTLFEVSLLRGGTAAAAALPRPDLVVAQMPSLAAGVVGARLAARHGVPFVPLVRNLLGVRAAAARAVERYALRRAALVGVAHETLVAGVAALGVPEDRIRLVPNWSLVPRPSRPREEMRALLGWRPGQTVLLACGPVDGVLVEAARLDPGLRVVVMAGRDERERLRAQAGGLPNLDLAPLPEDPELPDVLAAADVLAVTDPDVPPELTSYFGAGRPIVAAVPADCGTARELARAGAGLAVPPGAPAALLTATRALAADPAPATGGPAYAAAHLTREAALSRMDALLTEALATAAPAPADASPAPGPQSPPAQAAAHTPPRPEPTPAAPDDPPAVPTPSAPGDAAAEPLPAVEEDPAGSAPAELPPRPLSAPATDAAEVPPRLLSAPAQVPPRPEAPPVPPVGPGGSDGPSRTDESPSAPDVGPAGPGDAAAEPLPAVGEDSAGSAPAEVSAPATDAAELPPRPLSAPAQVPPRPEGPPVPPVGPGGSDGPSAAGGTPAAGALPDRPSAPPKPGRPPLPAHPPTAAPQGEPSGVDVTDQPGAAQEAAEASVEPGDAADDAQA